MGGTHMRMGMAAAALALLLGGCGLVDGLLPGGVDGALEDARARADELLADGRDVARTFEWCVGAAELGQAVVAGDVETARDEASALLGSAPEDLASDLRVVAEAAARAQVGDPRDLMDDDVQQAARDVYAHAVELCGLADG